VNAIRIIPLGLLLFSVSQLSGADTAPIPESALVLSDRTYCLEFHHTNLTPACRREAAQLTQIILNELMERNCKVVLSRAFLAEELEYYRRFRTNETSRTVCEQMEATLADARQSGEIDWKRLRKIHSDSSDSETISHGFPWLYPWRTVDPPKLAPETGGPPLLRFTFDWQGIASRGVASFNSQAYIGRSTLWKADAQLSFNGPSGEVNKHYPAPAWVQEYYDQDLRPIPILIRQLTEDLRRGLKAPPAPAPAKREESGRKKRK